MGDLWGQSRLKKRECVSSVTPGFLDVSWTTQSSLGYVKSDSNCSSRPPSSLRTFLFQFFLIDDLFFKCTYSLFCHPMCLQAWRNGHLGSTLTILEGMETTSVWRPSVFITGRESVRGLWRWRLALRIGWQRQTPGKLSTPVWRRASGALTRNSPMAAFAPTTMSAFSAHQVDMKTEAQTLHIPIKFPATLSPSRAVGGSPTIKAHSCLRSIILYDVITALR